MNKSLIAAILCAAFSASPVLEEAWMRGKDSTRNAVSKSHYGPIDWEIADDGTPVKNVRWSAALGTYSHGDPVVSQGLIWVGTNNSRPRDPAHREDGGVLMCFDKETGQFLYQYLSPRLSEGRDFDWPSSSQAGSPLIENDYLWFCNTRCEVVCLDIGPLIRRKGDPAVVWKVDLRGQFGVVPQAVMIGCNSVQCSVAEFRDWIYVNTTNAVAAGRHRVPEPNAPSLLCLEKKTGQVKWQDNSPGANLLDVQYGSPLVAEVGGQAQVIMGQGDGWMRGFDALTGEVLWKFDINHKGPERGMLRGDDRRSDLVAAPVFHQGRIYFAIGRHIEVDPGSGRLCCVDPTRRGDISSQIVGENGQVALNPNSGLIWEYLNAGEGDGRLMHRSLSSVVVHKGLVFAPDVTGLLHCVDAATGEGVWIHDLKDNLFGSPIIMVDTLYLGTEDGVSIFNVDRKKQILAERATPTPVESTPACANGALYVMTRDRLYAIKK